MGVCADYPNLFQTPGKRTRTNKNPSTRRDSTRIVSFSKGTFGSYGRAVSGCDYGTQCAACAQIRPYSQYIEIREDVCKYDLDADRVPDDTLCHDGSDVPGQRGGSWVRLDRQPLRARNSGVIEE